MKEFLFLYPIDEYINSSLRWFCGYHPEKLIQCRKIYSQVANSCIDQRYRQQGYHVAFTLFDNHPFTELINYQPTDQIINVGMDFTNFTTKLPNGEYPVIDPNIILDLFGKVRVLRVTGFHLHDCVDKVAEGAYQRGWDALVDEDLTELLPTVMDLPDFKTDHYPTYNPRNDPNFLDYFMKAREGKPWLWQVF